MDLGILDVMQIFGRAGRPQFDKYGEGTIITTHDKLSHYLTLLTQQNPIESQFLDSLADNLNAEVSQLVTISPVNVFFILPSLDAKLLFSFLKNRQTGLNVFLNDDLFNWSMEMMGGTQLHEAA